MEYLLIPIFLLILILVYAFMKRFASGYPLMGKLLISIGVILFTLAVIIYPEESFKSAYDGLKIWFNIVFPSLLPFFVGSELLVNLGIVNFTGTLLEPVMRPLFNVPGCGSFPFIMSITSGYPVGSKIVAQLYNDNSCTKTEAQRLLSFCSTSGPLFMISAVGIGMLNMEGAGQIIAVSNYIGALAVGVCFRFYKYREKPVSAPGSGNIKKAYRNLINSFTKENRPFGLLLSDSVKNSVNALLTIGGFIVLFSVVIRLMILSGFINVFSNMLSIILTVFETDKHLITPIASGLFEITIGSKFIAASDAVLNQKIAAISGIIAWSGFSIHAQVASMISTTDLKLSTYVLSKVLHSAASCVCAYIILSFGTIPGIINSLHVFSYKEVIDAGSQGWLTNLTISSERFAISIMICLCLAVIIRLTSRFYTFFSH